MADQVEIPLDHNDNYMTLDDRRRAALAEIDNAKFGWFHIRACIVSGIGFFTDSYDIFAINLVSVMLGFVYFSTNKNKLPANVDTAVKVAASVGTMVGQFGFGYLADHVGRKKMYGLELIIIIIATIGQSLAAQGPAISVWACIVFWRVILGIGIGGDYPLSAVITSEFATTKRRGAMMAAVFAMQGFGILAAAIVALLVLLGYKSAIQADVNTLDQVWRIVIGLGCVPAICALYFRLTIPETPRYTMDIEQKINKGAKDAFAFIERGATTGDYSEAEVIAKSDVPAASWSDFCHYFGQWKNGKVLLGTAYSWFALDIAWYGLGLNNSFILQTIQFSGGADAYTNLYNTIVGNIIINLLGSVPGYWITVFTIEKLGRKPIQLGGFIILTILFLILGFGYQPILNFSPALFLVLFTLAQLFFNFGPNSTTFIVPGEVFPTRYRSTGHGISAASGKFGAVVAQVGFASLKDIGGSNAWIDHLLQIFAFFMLTGCFSTLLIPETTGKSLEDLSGEDQTDFVREEPKK
jgi:PHS family inorganic phosphate transporter-like MFS transporter